MTGERESLPPHFEIWSKARREVQCLIDRPLGVSVEVIEGELEDPRELLRTRQAGRQGCEQVANPVATNHPKAMCGGGGGGVCGGGT